MKAELAADGGVGASSDDFFRSRPFLEAERATHTLVAGPARLPVIAREIPGGGGRLDAVSPYGYPGASLEDGAGSVDPRTLDWSGTQLVSLFVRDRVGVSPALAGGTLRSYVQVHDPAAPRRVRSRIAEQVRHNSRQGWAVDRAEGPVTSDHQRAAFLSLYTETMTRASAAPRYFFDDAYFEAILGYERSWLLLAAAGDTDIGAGAIAVLSDGVLHYYLGGTGDRWLDASPFKNVVAAMMDMADELALPLNLGGGVRPGDGLEDFKRGFANSELPFTTHEVICDPEAYEELAGPAEAGGFFPAYRA